MIIKDNSSQGLRNTAEINKDIQLKSDLLHVAIVDIYLNLKK